MNTVTTWHPGIVLASIDLSPEMEQAIKAALSSASRLALTAWAEARSRFNKTGTDPAGRPIGMWVKNPPEAMHDVMETVDARVRDGRQRWHGLDHGGVCLEPKAFSCWLRTAGADSNHDPRHLADNFEALMQRAQLLLSGETPSDTLLACLAMAESIVARGVLAPQLDGATHYYADWIAAPAWARPPAVQTASRYGHLFFKHVR